MAGVADALAEMSSFREGGEGRDTPHSTWFGYHLDLKPSNILITGRGNERTLVITDFGQAYFRRIRTGREDGTYSAITPNPGGIIYTPPDERVDSQGHIHRSFDVWSFGCILLEVAVYIIQGEEELTKFKLNRNSATTLNGLGNTACFYRLVRESNGTGRFVVKDVVSNRIKSLVDVGSHRFVTGVMKIVAEIFRDQPVRPTAREVANRLKDLLKLRDSNADARDPRERELARELRMQDGDVDLGDDQLKGMYDHL